MSSISDFSGTHITRGREETVRLGEDFARALPPCATLALYGDLGSGKTTFAKGLAAGLGVEDTVKSPSFNIYCVYSGSDRAFVHMDAYRLQSPAAYDDLLIDEIAPDPKILCVEWPENVEPSLPADTVKIFFSILPDSSHMIDVKV